MTQMEPTLSLRGELLLVAIDPNRGGLLARRKRRFRKGLAAAQGLPARMPLSAWRARRLALRRLQHSPPPAGLEPGAASDGVGGH
jgi:hypothetical protein